MATVKHKFKVGDRVIYRVASTGNTELDGWVGTVVGIDTTEAPYTVRFDNALYDMATDERFWKKGQPRGHDWWCKEENLSPVGVRRKTDSRGRLSLQGDDIAKKNGEIRQEGEGVMRKKHEWTAEEDKLIREMIEEGAPMVAIADRVGVDMVCLKNRLQKLRREDPMFPRQVKNPVKEQSVEWTDEMDAGLREMENDGCDPETICNQLGITQDQLREHQTYLEEQHQERGMLNDLEAAMAEQIKELTEEVERFAKRNAELTSENAELGQRVKELTEDIQGIAVEFEDGVAYYKGQIEKLESTVHTQLDHIENLMGEKALAQAEIARLQRVVVSLVERYVVG